MEKEQNNKVVDKKAMPTALKILKPSGTRRDLPTKQPGGVHTLTPLEWQARKILTFLVVAQVITLVKFHQLLLVCIPVLWQVLNQLHFPNILQKRSQ